MSPINKQTIIRKIAFIEEDLGRLEKYRSMSMDEYLESFEHQYLSERLLEKIIGRMIDINFHILKEKDGFLPKDYYESFMQMAKHQRISFKLADELKYAAGLRNALAHEYDGIDNAQVYAGIQRILKYVPLYLDEVKDVFS